jgi:tungstate transport system substrate-binding protein
MSVSRAWVAALLLWLAACVSPSAPPRLDIATTTSVQNSGLLDALLPRFTDAAVNVHATGSGRALEMFAKGDVRLVISHAPEAEARYLREHPNWHYRKIASNRFIIVGPAGDPARITGMTSAVDAFRAIVTSGAAFVSRGDGSGTHEREQRLWALAGATPTEATLLVSGRGMAQALRHAQEANAYTLSDEATFWQLDRDITLKVMVEGDPLLLNTYAVIWESDPIAAAFADWLSRAEGRRLMSEHRVAGRSAFTVGPASCPGDAPERLPCAPR